MVDIVLFDDAEFNLDLIETSSFRDIVDNTDIIDGEEIRQSSEEFRDLFLGELSTLTFSNYAMLIHQHLSKLHVDVGLEISDDNATVSAKSTDLDMQEMLLDRVEDLLSEMAHFDNKYTDNGFSVHRVNTRNDGNTLAVMVSFRSF